MNNHDLLIEKLSRDMQPVQPMRPTYWRVLMWLLLALPCGIVASFLVQRTLTDWSQPGAMRALIQLALAFVLGLFAIRNAFNMSIPGRRSVSWKVLLPLGLLWLGLSLSSIPHAVVEAHDNDSTRCFTFLLVVSTPMMVLMIASLRKTRALHPVRSLAMAGLGISCMAVTMLAFCHPVHLHPMDFVMHLAAIAVIIVLTVLLGRRWVRLG